MKEPAYRETFEILCLQAGNKGREALLFGDSMPRVRNAVPPFLVGKRFPEIYFEFPFTGSPFLDVTILYGELDPGTRIASPAAGDCGPLLDWIEKARRDHTNISFGFELDTNQTELPLAAIYFQPGVNTELAVPFCELLGESGRGILYRDMARQMPKGWPLSFFGSFRGRGDFPLRVCGYLGCDEKKACAADPTHIAAAFDRIGFAAYDKQMITQIAEVLRIAPRSVDFQFDLLSDGSLGDIFSLGICVLENSASSMRRSFECGPLAHLMNYLKVQGLADERTDLIKSSVMKLLVPVECCDGSDAKYLFAYRPKWIKVRWKNGKLKQAKGYMLLTGCRV